LNFRAEGADPTATRRACAHPWYLLALLPSGPDAVREPGDCTSSGPRYGPRDDRAGSADPSAL